MARPVVHATTERYYAALPEFYRSADADRDWPLLRFLSLMADQLGELEDLIDRIDYVTPGDGGAPGDTSDLVDPVTADAAWLPWLAQFLGPPAPASLSEAGQRNRITTASAGWRAGTKSAMADAARTTLTDTQYVLIRDHYGGDQWRVEVRTRATQTPDPAAVLQAIIDAGAKPAGVELVGTTYVTTWTAYYAAFPTWADVAADAPTWNDWEEAGAP